ncbi:MAG: T9SS type A sorting domain-containing protein [Fibrobacter sp.]|nr:T9SS type A sorting domain-containing protein [Fibrobacter sp.]
MNIHIVRQICVLAGSLLLISSAVADAETVNINFKERMQTFDGWGASLCWWAVRVGSWNEKRARELAALITDPDTGLGLSIFRYNIGGGENPAHNHMRAGGAVPGYKSSENAAYNWNADPYQRAMLKYLIDCCPQAILEAFSNSPPYWMTKSGCSSGNTDGSNNLKDDYYDDFATYLVDIVKHFKEQWGITFSTLEPLNESEASWWKALGSQEGCHFDRKSQEKIIKELYAKLKAEGLESTIKISVDDANSIDACLANLNAWSGDVFSCIGRINTHSYYGSQRAALRNRVNALKLPLYQSESGPLGWSGTSVYDAALFMSRRIIDDLNKMQAEAWLDWQLLDESSTWEIILTNWTGEQFSKGINFFARTSFTRFIRPGWSICTTRNDNIVSAVAPDGKHFGIVILNDQNADKTYTVTLTNADTGIYSVELYRSSETDQCLPLKTVTVKNNTITVPVKARSILSIRPQNPESTPLRGKLISKGEPWQNDTAHSCTKALDGDAETYADCFGDSLWVGYDFENNFAEIKRIELLPRKGYAERVTGKRFEISTDGKTWTPVYTVTEKPSDGRFLRINFDKPLLCKAIRYNGMNDNINVAEIAFYGKLKSDTVPVTRQENRDILTPKNFSVSLNKRKHTIDCVFPVKNSWKVSICEINGKIRYSKKLSETDIFTIDLPALSEGVYIITITNKNGTERQSALFSTF